MEFIQFICNSKKNDREVSKIKNELVRETNKVTRKIKHLNTAIRKSPTLDIARAVGALKNGK